VETRNAKTGRLIAGDFMPIFVTAPLFGVICGLLLAALWH